MHLKSADRPTRPEKSEKNGKNKRRSLLFLVAKEKVIPERNDDLPLSPFSAVWDSCFAENYAPDPSSLAFGARQAGRQERARRRGRKKEGRREDRTLFWKVSRARKKVPRNLDLSFLPPSPPLDPWGRRYIGCLASLLPSFPVCTLVAEEINDFSRFFGTLEITLERWRFFYFDLLSDLLSVS